jgi:hypothetical protein
MRTVRGGTAAAVCGALTSGLSSRGQSLLSIRRISSRIAISGSMKRSSSGSDAGGLLERPQFKDALVGHASVAAGVERREMVAEAVAHVVGREDRRRRRPPPPGPDRRGSVADPLRRG